ncbi:MAG: Asp23/Gls24 family envelope stress response protein [Peptococcaceae bacterium]|nr:Asp23/Gls24 family envelope stress response protein [Peptococcaceae bacterium]
MDSHPDSHPAQNDQELGKLKISAETIGAMIPPVVSGVGGVSALAGGRMDGLGEMVGVKKMTRGVRVAVKEEGILIDIHIIVNFGCRIPEAARKIQLETKKVVEEMTGQRVIAVNVIVDGVDFTQPEKARRADGFQDEPGTSPRKDG